ncbi:MAG: helix-hairpin-helix domain-containing protein [Bacteroidales bacterium]|nr:helix-hairpin-helix domain-containing protein [Bacteroidales bacterium]
MKASTRTGVISLAFLVLGFQLALFVHKAAVARIVANRDRPDTVFVVAGREEPSEVTGSSGRHSGKARMIYEQAPQRRVESFRFNPNTAGMPELQRLGFSEKQAQSILNYREKGGRFRRKADFAKSFAVPDSVYRRLEPYIDIPKIDINKADSATFDSLPGIGGWFARRMVEYREQLRGYSCPEQLMEIYHFDREKYDGLKDLITCSASEPYPFWSGSLEDIRMHPHVRRYDTARAIVLYRDNTAAEQHNVEGLLSAGIITEEQAVKLRRCRLD